MPDDDGFDDEFDDVLLFVLPEDARPTLKYGFPLVPGNPRAGTIFVKPDGDVRHVIWKEFANETESLT